MERDKIKFFICNSCHGKGFIANQKCPECHGMAVVVPFYGRFLYWGKKIDQLNIIADRFILIVNRAFNLILVLLSLAGILGTFIMASRSNFSNVLNMDYWLTPGLDKLILWFSIFIIMYLYYRLSLESSPRRRVLNRVFIKHPKVPEFIDWSYIMKQPRSKFIDIAQTFDGEAIRLVDTAWELARQMDHREVSRIHLFAVLSNFNAGALMWGRLGVNFAVLKEKFGRVLSWKLEKQADYTDISHRVYRILLEAYINAYDENKKKVQVPDIIEAMLDVKLLDDNERATDYVEKILIDLDLNYQKLINVIAWQRLQQRMREGLQRFRQLAHFKPKTGMDRAMTAVATPYLNRFGDDLTLAARNGYLFPCIGREKEFDQILRIIEGSKDGVLLVGNIGVGRSAVLDGLAQRMVEESVPDVLQDKRLVKLSIAQVISGASVGDAEERLLLVLNEVAHSGNIVLVIEDIHNIVGVGAGNGGLDLSEVLAEVLRKRLFPILATTSPEQYVKSIENSGLREVFQTVKIEELELNEAIQVLEAKSGEYEYQNNVYFSYDSIEQAAVLSDKYIHDQYLPDKALELMQIAAINAAKERGARAVVTATDIASILAARTGIQTAKITEAETDKLLNLESEIHARVVGQEEAVKMVAASLRRARAELRDEKRPISTMLFLGPTGVGKTELAKTVAAVYFGAEDKMLRFDMSEFQEQHSLTRLIGAGEDGGILTDAVRQNPFSLVLFDEIEKAHPDILNLFLQMLDDGRLTDGRGRTIDFTNTIIIMTSNAGATMIQEAVKNNVPMVQLKDRLINDELKNNFRPEFLNRFDGVIVFSPLTMKEVIQIARLLAAKVISRLAEKEIYLTISDEAIAELSELGFDPQFGARPLRRVIQERVDDLLANALLKGEIGKRDKVTLLPNQELKIEKAEII